VAKTPSRRDYALAKDRPARRLRAPDLPYLPRDPAGWKPGIGLVGCGGISATHLGAYAKAGYRVVVLCDRMIEKARRRQREFFPRADVTDDWRRVVDRADVEVVDLTPHPMDRLPLIEGALEAGKHVLSQKPFVMDLAEGERLVRLARRRGVKLAVNQNGRFAPHFSWIRHAVARGLIGDVLSVHARVHWDHTWTRGTPFERIRELVLYDFGIHWFDLASALIGDRRIETVFARKTKARGQRMRPPLLAEAVIGFDGGQASLVFDAAMPYGPRDETYVGGTRGSIRSEGPSLGEQTVTLHAAGGWARPDLKGHWFVEGFHGAMAELLNAVVERREPIHGAAENLRSLALCFAAVASSESGRPVRPGTVRRLPPGSAPGA
jgi:predicted dehydrogenase